MRMLQAYKSKKYLFRIMLSITFLMVIVLSLSSVVLHYSSEQRVLHIQQEANRKVMNQINHNNAYLQEIVKNLALRLYSSNQITPLMTERTADSFDMINGIKELSGVNDTSAFLHSVMVYNAHTQRIHAVGELAAEKPGYELAVRLADLLKGERKLPQMRLLPMNLSRKEHAVDFFSLFIYETYNQSSTDDSVLVINVRPEWIFDNLKAVNDFAAANNSNLFMMDSTGQVILSGNQNPFPALELQKQELLRKQQENRSDYGFFTPDYKGHGKYLVTYMNMGAGDWKVVSVQPYKAVLGDIYKMRTTSVGVILSFLALSILVSVVIAHKLYQPVENMMTRIRDQLQSEEGLNRGQDELSFVTNVHSELIHKLYRTTDERDKQKSIVRNYYTRSLITNSLSMTEPEFRDCAVRNGMRIKPEGPFLLVIAKFDQQADFLSQTSHKQRMLYFFAVTNIAEEIVSQDRLSCEAVDMRGDHIVLLLSGDEVKRYAEGNGDGAILATLSRIQDVVQDYYKLSVTMTVSNPTASHRDLTARYNQAMQISMYKLLFGMKSIITPDMVEANNSQYEYQLPAEPEKKLVEAIRTGDLAAMEAGISQVLNHLSGFHYDHIIHGVLHVVDIIKSTIREMNGLRVSTVTIDLSSLSRQILEKETLEELEELFHSICRDIHDKLKNAGQEKNAALVEAVKDIITTQYNDVNLSLQGIAATLKMTPAYVGRMFKQAEFVSVGEYINEVRLNQARQFLETKNLSIKEIMELVGFLNESTFFKLFKKKYGVTPKEYRLKSNIG